MTEEQHGRFSTWQQEPYGENNGNEFPLVFHLDYYQRVFMLLHQQLETAGYDPEQPHPIRARFWRLLPYREYSPLKSREFLHQYLNSVECELAGIVGEHSLAYWLHLYRRLAPGPIGEDKKPGAIGLVRTALEAAIQKYARFQPCDRVGITNEIPIDSVLGGILMAPEFEVEREGLQKMNQLVLTDFSSAELREFYDVERLAYELWRSSAMLRVTGKGAPIAIGDFRASVIDLRSPELRRLIEIFDSRLGNESPGLSATGTMLAYDGLGHQTAGIVFLPTYNLGGISTDELAPFFEKVFNLELILPIQPNFIWLPLNLRDYREVHKPFAQAFEEKHGIGLDAALVVIAALCQRLFSMWVATGGNATIRYFQRAYEGPYIRQYVLDEIGDYVTDATRLLNLEEGQVDQSELAEAVRFWELDSSKRDDIDLAYPGPQYVFLPYGENRVFIDYAWLFRRLYDLFAGVSLPDQSFKGDVLETIVRRKESVLPVRGCRSTDGTKKQVDAAFKVGSRLVIVECKAISRSIGFDRGNPEAIRYRNRKIDKALAEVDEKAQWLSNHPLGTNYDIRSFRDILPIVVTPFIEYIHSLHSRYWLKEELPRVLTPKELRRALDDGTFVSVSANAVTIQNRSDLHAV
jgi:hypothetical protein